MTNAERRQQQAQIERDWTADQQARHNEPPSPPPLESNAYCAVARDHRHHGWTSQDGKRRCQSCCAVFDPASGTWQSAIEAARAQEQAAITIHGGER